MTLRTFTFGHKLLGPFLGGSRVIALHDVAQILDDTVESYKVVAGSVDYLFIYAYILQ